jgi:hypothetical protein
MRPPAAVVVVANINGDGFEDVIAGAPHDGGSIAIYPGSTAGPDNGQQYTQDSPRVPRPPAARR